MNDAAQRPPWGPVLVFELGAVGAAGIAFGPRPAPAARPKAAARTAQPGVYGVQVERLVQVLEPVPLTEVPLAPAVVLGIMSFHGRIVTVINPAPMLGLDEAAIAGSESRVVLLRHGRVGGNVGLWVTRVETIVPAEELAPTGIVTPGVRWVAQQGQRLVNIVDVDALLSGLAQELASVSGPQPRQGVAG